jgi:hypothetical protein
MYDVTIITMGGGVYVCMERDELDKLIEDWGGRLSHPNGLTRTYHTVWSHGEQQDGKLHVRVDTITAIHEEVVPPDREEVEDGTR